VLITIPHPRLSPRLCMSHAPILKRRTLQPMPNPSPSTTSRTWHQALPFIPPLTQLPTPLPAPTDHKRMSIHPTDHMLPCPPPQIHSFLERLLGDPNSKDQRAAPHPVWGLPDGWGNYLAQLFTWATGRSITKEEAMKCARRHSGRSWEAVGERLR
jgi:hypothetical protein